GLPDIVAAGGQLALLGTGDSDLEQGFAAAAKQYRGRVGVEIGYDESLAQLIIARADVILVPSRFEPCGLTQLYALRYGTLPLVRRVGGLHEAALCENSHPPVADRDHLADLASPHHADGPGSDLACIEQIEFTLAEIRPGAGRGVAAADQVVDEIDMVRPVDVRFGLTHP